MSATRATPVRSLLRRDRRERALLVESYLVVFAARAALTLVPYPLLRRLRGPVLRLAGALSPRGRRAEGPKDRVSIDHHRSGDAYAVVSAVRVAARHVRDASCLTQAVALHLMLARRGVASELVVGVSRRNGSFESHAWVDRDGETLIGGDVSPFDPLVRASSDRRSGDRDSSDRSARNGASRAGGGDAR